MGQHTYHQEAQIPFTGFGPGSHLWQLSQCKLDQFSTMEENKIYCHMDIHLTKYLHKIFNILWIWVSLAVSSAHVEYTCMVLQYRMFMTCYTIHYYPWDLQRLIVIDEKQLPWFCIDVDKLWVASNLLEPFGRFILSSVSIWVHIFVVFSWFGWFFF